MRHLATLFHSAWIVLVMTLPCFAQDTGEGEAAKSYVMPYFIVGLGVALGLVAVCRMSKRHKEVRRPE